MTGNLLRNFYSKHLRGGLRNILFGSGRLSVEIRKDLLSSTPVESIWSYGQCETIELTEPTHVGGLPNEIEKKIGTWNIDPPFVIPRDDVQLVGPDALLISQSNSYILETVEGSTYRATDAIVKSLLNGVFPRRRPTNSEYDVAVSLAGPWSNQFFHWFVEYLPRLLAVEEYVKVSSIEPIYFLPANRPDWLSRSLELFDIPDERMVSWNGCRVNVQRLILPSLWRDTESTAPPEGYVHSPRGIREVSKRLRENVSTSTTIDGLRSRLYISRSGAPMRNVVNEDELQPVLDDYDFEVIHPERWSLDEQIAIFANADVVAGPHGGGLTNAMYASNPKVMEFFGRDTNPCYFALFAGSGSDYGLVNGEANGCDIRVEPDDFRRLCEQMLD